MNLIVLPGGGVRAALEASTRITPAANRISLRGAVCLWTRLPCAETLLSVHGRQHHFISCPARVATRLKWRLSSVHVDARASHPQW